MDQARYEAHAQPLYEVAPVQVHPDHVQQGSVGQASAQHFTAGHHFGGQVVAINGLVFAAALEVVHRIAVRQVQILRAGEIEQVAVIAGLDPVI